MAELLKTLIDIFLSILMVSGVCIMAANYDGPFGIFYKLRTSRLSKLFDCEVCLTPYIGLIALVGFNLSLMQYLAVVGASVLICRSL